MSAEVADLQGALSDSRHWAKETVLRLADAESVAAKLVEVICEQEEIIAGERMLARAAIKACNGLGRERDAARAEVAALRERIDSEALAAVKARTEEIGAIVEREVLADLRAQVEAAMPTAREDFGGPFTALEWVLALLEGEDQ